MKTTIVDLRYRMKEVLKALDRRENVSILYHGKLKGIIIPADASTGQAVQGHPLFGMSREEKRPVEEVMEDLRGGRQDAV